MSSSPREKPLLIYRDTCAKCRLLSLIAVVLLLGRIKRLANSSNTAAALYRQHGAVRAKLAMYYRHRLVTGPPVVYLLTRFGFQLWTLAIVVASAFILVAQIL